MSLHELISSKRCRYLIIRSLFWLRKWNKINKYWWLIKRRYLKSIKKRKEIHKLIWYSNKWGKTIKKIQNICKY